MNGFLSRIRPRKGGREIVENSHSEESPEAEGPRGVVELSEEHTARVQRFARSTSVVHTLAETVRDAGALPYFIQFMESLGQLHLVKFLLHVDGFKASAANASRGGLLELQQSKDDAGSIYAQYVCVDGASSLGLPEELRKTVIDRVCAHDGSIDAGSFDTAYEHILKLLDDRHFKQFLLSVYYNKHLIDVLGSGALSLADILKTQLLLCAFIDFLDSEDARAFLEFLIAAESFCEELRDCADDSQALDDAMIIYDKFFSMQATDPLHFGDRVRTTVEEKICTTSGRPEADCFRTPMRMAIVTLQERYIAKFVCSQPFAKILNELHASVASHVEMPETGHSRRAAPGPPERSSVSEASFPSLAVCEKSPSDVGKARLRLGSASGSRLLSTDDEDTISQCSSNGAFTTHFRRNKSGMSLAKVDEFGRYSALYGTDWGEGDATKRKGTIRNTLERYLNQSTAKERQIADQVARLIIADVQNMVSEANNLATGCGSPLGRNPHL